MKVGLGRRVLGRFRREVSSLVARTLARVAPERAVELYLDRPLTICLPFRSSEELGEQLQGIAQIKSLEDQFGSAQLIFVTLTGWTADESMVCAIRKHSASLTFVPDFRSLISFLAGAQFRIVLPKEVGQAESLRTWCDAFHVGYANSMVDLVQSLLERGPLKLAGPFAATHAVHKALWLSVMGNQYAFAEPLDWNIIRQLPRKFIELRARAELHVHPIALLTGPLNRITRQRAVGRLYANYLQGESVMDIGCDVRGLAESVGPRTRYVGIDMHGRPDLVLNLDRQPLPFGPRSIETIVCIETLEHLQNIHTVLDDLMSVSGRFVIGSLPVEPAFSGNRIVDPIGGPLSFQTPVAPVFDRHQWLGSISDNLDLIYYRSERNGFAIRRLDLFHMPGRGGRSEAAVLNSFRRGRIADLNRQVGLIMFVLERKES